MEEVKPQEQRLDSLGRKISPRKPTLKQKRLLDALVENGSGSKKEAMIKAGYSPNTAIVPDKAFESQSFKELMRECGLTENLIAKSLVEDIKAKPKNRKPELELGAKILKMTEEEKNPTQNQYNFFFQDEQSKRIAKRLINLNRETGGNDVRDSAGEKKLN